jgi:hypothetical protein
MWIALSQREALYPRKAQQHEPELEAKNNSGSSNSAAPKLAKMDFPKYSGIEDPTSWVYRVE